MPRQKVAEKKLSTHSRAQRKTSASQFICLLSLVLLYFIPGVYVYICDKLTDNANEVFGFSYDSTAW